MSSYRPPTAAQIEEAKLLLAHPQMQRSFFEGLRNTAWIADLRAAGFFNSPPEPIIDETAQTVQYRAWPQMVYLRHVALNGTPDEVAVSFSVLQGIQTDDPYVRSDILGLAANVDASRAEQIVKSQFRWLRTQSELWLTTGDHIVPIARALLSGGRQETAFELLRIAAGVREGPRPKPIFGDRATSRLKDYYFTEVWLGVAVDLGSLADDAGFRLILGELDRALKLENPDPDLEHDMSVIATREIRPAVRDAVIDIVSTLALALLECSLALSKWVPLRNIVAQLIPSRWLTVRRVAAQLLAESGDAPVDLVETQILLDELFNGEATPEAWNLLRAHWRRIDENIRTEYLNRATNVPDERMTRWRSRATEEEIPRLAHGWRMTFLGKIVNQLADGDFERFNASRGEIEGWAKENEGPPAGVAVCVQSPKDSDELLAMEPGELAEYLNTWAPAPGNWWLDRYALAGQWRDAVAKSPEMIGLLGPGIGGLKPEMLGEAARGVSQAIRNGARPGIDSIRELLATMLRMVEETSSKEFVQAILSLVGSLLSARADLLSENDADLLWSALSRFASDPDPSPEHESEYGPPNMDWFTLALNTVRPKALRLIVEFALWQKSLHGTFAFTQDAGRTITVHLDPVAEPSLAVRSTFGALSPQLFVLDKDWFAGHAEEIFPTGVGHRLHFLAAFEAYVLYSRFYIDLFPAITNAYRRAVELVNDPSWDKSRGERAVTRLAEHLQAGYIHGLIEVDDPMLQGFYLNSNAEIRKEALTQLGYDLMRLEGKIQPELCEKWMKFWEFIASAVLEPSGSQSEYAAFGRWFESGLFPPDWALGQLQIALSKCKFLDDSHGVMEKLSELSPTHAAGVLPVFEHIVDNPESVWALGMWRESVLIITRNLMKSADPEVARRTDVARNKLGAKGLLQLGDIE